MTLWLDRFPWEWFATLTFRDDPPWFRCYQLWGEMLRWMRRQGAYPSYFRGVEYQERGVLHFHALLYGVSAVRRMALVDWWWQHAGMARVLAYERKRGARHYISKYLTKDAKGWGTWTLQLASQKTLALEPRKRA